MLCHVRHVRYLHYPLRQLLVHVLSVTEELLPIVVSISGGTFGQ